MSTFPFTELGRFYPWWGADASAASVGADTISLSDEDAVKQVLVDTVLGLWDLVNNLTRLRPRRDRYQVTIFGPTRARPGSFAYEEMKRVAAVLVALGCDIITGGGPGLMQAANEGAAAGGGQAQSVGIRIDLPFEQEVNAFVGMASVLSTDPPLASPEDMSIPRCVPSGPLPGTAGTATGGQHPVEVFASPALT